MIAGAIPVISLLCVMSWNAKRTADQAGYFTLSRLAAQVSHQVWLAVASATQELKALPENPILVESTNSVEARTAEISRLAAVHDLFTEISLYDSDGYIIASTSSVSTSWEATTWFRRALKGQMTISRPYVGRRTDRLEFAVYLPVAAGPKRDVAVIKAKLPFSSITSLLGNVDMQDGSRLLLVDRYGNLLADNQGKVMERFELGPQLKAEHWGVLERNGESFHYITKPCQTPGMLPDEPMCLIWMVPSKEFTAPYNRSLAYIGIAGGFSILPVAALSWLFARSFTRPLTRSAKIANQMADGDHNQSIPVLGTLEMQQLARSFNALVKNLNKRARDLETAYRDMEQASRIKDQFLSVISHELRTPLNAILGLTSGLGQNLYGPISDSQAECLKTIEDSGKRLLCQINDALDAAKLVAGEFELHKKEVNLSEIVQVSISTAQEEAHAKGLQIDQTLDPQLTGLEADEGCLLQVMAHLLSNAIKFTPSGGSIRVETTYLDSSNEAEIRVTDTGIGISQENLPMLFQRFVQLDADRDRCFSGTGIGLYSVKSITEMHGGSVAVKSELGSGSTFIVRLPNPVVERPNISAQEEAPTPPPSIIKTPPRPVTVQGSTQDVTPSQCPPSDASGKDCECLAINVLLIDDSELGIISIKSLLANANHNVLVAKTKAEATQCLEESKPDLILLDLDHFEMEIAAFIQEIREHPKAKDLPIVALVSQSTFQEHEPQSFGADEFLAKPVRLTALDQAICKFSPKAADPSCNSPSTTIAA